MHTLVLAEIVGEMGVLVFDVLLYELYLRLGQGGGQLNFLGLGSSGGNVSAGAN